MKKYREVLEKYHIKPISYVKRGKSLIIETKENKFAIKENIKNYFMNLLLAKILNDFYL